MPAALPRITVAMPAKPWWASRTIWLNAVVLAAAAAESQLHVLQPAVPVNLYAVVAFALPVLNTWLRVTTTKALCVPKRRSRKAGPATATVSSRPAQSATADAFPDTHPGAQP